MVSISSFAAEASSTGTYVIFVVSSEKDKAYWIEAPLHRLEDVRGASVLSDVGPVSQRDWIQPVKPYCCFAAGCRTVAR
jgi:hypothetical protein